MPSIHFDIVPQVLEDIDDQSRQSYQQERQNNSNDPEYVCRTGKQLRRAWRSHSPQKGRKYRPQLEPSYPPKYWQLDRRQTVEEPVH